ncbi:MAG TPA: hypothetical protein EYP85_12585 [Armatimonadetes bacterium]|nr:hypothetical protein [Armatimonadota bacterium]
MLKVRVEDLLASGVEEKVFPFGERLALDEQTDPLWQGEVTGQIRIQVAGQRLLVRGQVRAEVPLECARCLTPFQYVCECEVEEHYLVGTGNERVMADGPERWTEEGELLVLPEELIDLSELVRQAVLLALPIQPLCREDCPGLGGMATMREGETLIDPRWQKLRALLEKKE